MTNERMRTSGLLAREVDGEILLLDIDADRVHQLNASASIIWRLYTDGASVDEIVKQLAIEFDVSEDKARRDVEEALAKFRELDIVK